MKKACLAVALAGFACGSTTRTLGPQATPCDTYCALALRHCTRGNLLYDSMAGCLSVCSDLPEGGDDGDLQGDTVQCRISWLMAAPRQPRALCRNGARDGGMACH